jgi:hypothetical protein
MIADIQPIVLVIDKSLLDIALFETTWMQAGHDNEIGVIACTTYQEAMTLLCDEIPAKNVISGVLVDLMLFDEAGRSAVDRLSDLPILRDVPVISWIGIDLGKRLTNTITESATHVWTKPCDWLAWSDFIHRFKNVVGSRSSTSSTGITGSGSASKMSV